MKRYYILALAILCSVLNVIAAAKVDLIIKMNSEKIEAIIQEVSDTELRYKKANNPNGPMFVIKLDEVASIVYANGEVQAIEHKAAPQPQAQPQPQSNNFNNGYGYNGYNGAYGYNAYNAANPYNGPLRRIDNKTWMYQDHRMSTKEMKFFLQQTCPQAYNYYKTWTGVEAAGWSIFGTGVAFLVGIGVGCWCSCYGLNYSPWYYAEGQIGFSFMIIGGAFIAGSVPMIACGSIYKKRVDQVYNVQCSNRNAAFAPQLKLTSGVNGLGLALSF